MCRREGYELTVETIHSNVDVQLATRRLDHISGVRYESQRDFLVIL